MTRPTRCVRVRPYTADEVPPCPEGMSQGSFDESLRRAWTKAVRHYARRIQREPLISASPIEDVADDFDDTICRQALATIIGPDGHPFPWGPILATHSIGEYDIITFAQQQADNVSDEDWAARLDESGLCLRYHGYINRVSVNRTWGDFDEILVGLIATKHESRDGYQAATYFGRMIGAGW